MTRAVRTTLAAAMLVTACGLARAQGDEAAPDATKAVADNTAAAQPAIVIRCADGTVIRALEIVTMDAETLRVRTALLDELEVRWPQVRSIESGQALRLEFKDGREVTGMLRPLSPGRVELVPIDGRASHPRPVERISLGDVHGINRSDDAKLVGRGLLHAGASVVDGNSQGRSVSLLGEFEVRYQPHRFSADAAWNYGDRSGVPNMRNTRGSARYDYFITDRLYGWTSVLAEEDHFRDLDLRTALSVGPGWQFVDVGDYPNDYFKGYRYFNEVEFAGEAGLAWVKEDYHRGRGNDYLAARWHARIEWPFYPGVYLFHRHEGFPSLEDAKDVFVRSEQGVRVDVWRGLTASFQVNWYWDNTPAPGRGRDELLYLFTVGYTASF